MMNHAIHIPGADRRPAGAGRDIIDRLRTMLRRQRIYNRTYSELAQLSDRALADVGLRRDAIDSVALATAERDVPR